ncbi:hypothetical protein V8E53_009965 [Lactarius tabidus]
MGIICSCIMDIGCCILGTLVCISGCLECLVESIVGCVIAAVLGVILGSIYLVCACICGFREEPEPEDRSTTRRSTRKVWTTSKVWTTRKTVVIAKERSPAGNASRKEGASKSASVVGKGVPVGESSARKAKWEVHREVNQSSVRGTQWEGRRSSARETQWEVRLEVRRQSPIRGVRVDYCSNKWCLSCSRSLWKKCDIVLHMGGTTCSSVTHVEGSTFITSCT